jgi:hypothetical protein
METPHDRMETPHDRMRHVGRHGYWRTVLITRFLPLPKVL